MKIGGREIGTEPYIIAELGVNHDGDASRALEMVDMAARAGADAIKLQCFRAELLMSRGSRLATYQERAGETDPIEMLRRLELTWEVLEACVERAHRRGVHAIVTVFSVELVEVAARLGWDAFKTASPDIVHRPLLEALAATGRPLIVSTGASTREEVARAAGWLRGVRDAALLQCVSCYPTPLEQANLGAMADLATVFNGPIGYSDHTAEVETGALAVQSGAVILEKHVTWNRAAKGPDHAASLDEVGFGAYVSACRGKMQGRPPHPCRAGPDVRAHAAYGSGRKEVLEIERDVRSASRQSIVARRALRAGERIEASDLTFKRPGTGLEPWRIGEVVGRIAARAIGADEVVGVEDVARAVAAAV